LIIFFCHIAAASVFDVDEEGNTPLHIAAAGDISHKNNYQIIQSFLVNYLMFISRKSDQDGALP
jgi:hypothetical protein